MLPAMHGFGMGSWGQRWKVVITIPVEIYTPNLATGQSACRLDPRVPDPPGIARCDCTLADITQFPIIGVLTS